MNEPYLPWDAWIGVTAFLPDPKLFLYFYVRKEAVLSSQIEGTQSSLADLLLYETTHIPGVPIDDVEEVFSYVAALNHAMDSIRIGCMPICNRLIRDAHRVLLARGRGSRRGPGEFRRVQNWIGGSRPSNAVYIPPPPERIESCMTDLERFLNDDTIRVPTLIKAALAHVQFETIHPFLDGNGRIGRLLITLILASEGVLTEPLLYLSLYFRTYRQQYYDLLQQTRLEGDWEAWLGFFLEGVAVTAEQAARSVQRILHLFNADRENIASIGRAAGKHP